VTESQVTLGEVYRLVKALKDEHGDKLDAIDGQVRLTNGRTTRLEEQVFRLNQEMRDVKHVPESVPVVNQDGESLSINARVSPKMWAAMASFVTGLTIFAPMVAEWLRRWAAQR